MCIRDRFCTVHTVINAAGTASTYSVLAKAKANRKNNNQLQIELKEEVAQGTYANLAIITHSSSEFIVDFVRVQGSVQYVTALQLWAIPALHADVYKRQVVGLNLRTAIFIKYCYKNQ